MHLVHVRLNDINRHVESDFSSFLMSCAVEEEHLEHVVVHEGPPPTLGLFLTAGSVEQAQRAADAVVRRALDSHPELAPGTVEFCRTPLVAPPSYEQLLAVQFPGGGLLMTPPDQDSSER
ncbi:hypothetical protein [Streptomyces chattanoogensis]|uniref:hypothetical protein n=1 Tax=Streptomyces chattanoogensis TaxID=66876 RepID=UPI00131E62C7|nr:hypothetical protein T261_3462 [Streptomyces lydicus]